MLAALPDAWIPKDSFAHSEVPHRMSAACFLSVVHAWADHNSHGWTLLPQRDESGSVADDEGIVTEENERAQAVSTPPRPASRAAPDSSSNIQGMSIGDLCFICLCLDHEPLPLQQRNICMHKAFPLQREYHSPCREGLPEAAQRTSSPPHASGQFAARRGCTHTITHVLLLRHSPFLMTTVQQPPTPQPAPTPTAAQV